MPDQPFHDLITNTAGQPWLDRALCGDLPLEELALYFVEAGRSISLSDDRAVHALPGPT